MKNLTFVVVLLLVAVASYSFGRRNASSTVQSAAPIPAPSKETISIQKPNGGPVVAANNPPPADAPFAQNMTAAQRGFAAASLNIDDALNTIESLPVPERMGFVHGIFSFVAKNHTPADALAIYKKTPDGQKANALRGLVGEWIYTRSPLDEEARYLRREGTLTINGSRQGLEVELTAMLAAAQPDVELTSAWLDAFSNHSSRSEILSQLAPQMRGDNPAALLKRTEGWTSWEKERFTRQFLSSWAYTKPQEAWEWYQSQRGNLGQDFTSTILGPWVAADSNAATTILSSLTDPNQRQTAIEVIGKMLGERNTNAGIDWADSMVDEKERTAAHRSVYDGAPRGIGAVLDFKNGFPTLRAIVAGSPLDGTGAKPGDQFVELRLPDGSTHPLYGRDLASTVNLIRGEPGSELTLRILRENNKSGSLEEHFIPVTRGQLYLNEKLIPKTATP
jgi:hypothetical protein